MTALICKSDCEFSQNDDRMCSLDLVELSQNQESSPTLVCNQYVRARFNKKHVDIDITRAKMAGYKQAFMGKLKA